VIIADTSLESGNYTVCILRVILMSCEPSFAFIIASFVNSFVGYFKSLFDALGSDLILRSFKFIELHIVNLFLGVKSKESCLRIIAM
jgi:hypothetical protein